MYTNPQKRSEPEAQALRKEAGVWLRNKREERGLSQRQLADILNLDYYTFISQLETGRGRIPPERLVDWANALGIMPRDFVFALLRYYDPITFAILFEDADKGTQGENFG